MSRGFRRVAVLGVTSLGTWAVYGVAAPSDEKTPDSSAPPAQIAKARKAADTPPQLKIVRRKPM
jgi:hypothetical protein